MVNSSTLYCGQITQRLSLKKSYLFFYLDHIVRKGDFLRVDLQFLLEGHSLSICDRLFGCIQQFFNTKEKIETPQKWKMTLRNMAESSVCKIPLLL